MTRAARLVATLLSLAAGACATTPKPAAQAMTADDLDRLAANEERNPSLAEQARDHRASAAAMREEEKRWCAGLPDADRDAAPFAQRELVRVAELNETEVLGKHGFQKVRGAQIFVRAAPGVTRQWLGRVLHCHVAAHAVRHSADMSDDPLAVPGAQVAIDDTETGFVVTVRSNDETQAREIVRRAQKLVAGP